MAEQAFALVPRDGFFFKDGRGWHTSASGRGHSLDWPAPPTMLGALRTTVGRLLEASAPGKPFESKDFDAKTKAITLGTTLPLRRPVEIREAWSAKHRCWPVPADALYLRGEATILTLDPVGPPVRPNVPTLGRNDDIARESLWRPVRDDLAKPEEPPRWWTNADMLEWVAGKMPEKHAPAQKNALGLARRTDVHVGMNSVTQTAEESMLFTSETMEPMSKQNTMQWEWAVGLSALIPYEVDASSVVWTLGSDRRIARAHDVDGLLDAPKFTHKSKRIRLLIVTPTYFERGWCPNGFEVTNGEYHGTLGNMAVVLRAAFVPRPMFLSGWDMALNRPKPTRSLVAPGAVYFFEKLDGRDFSPDEMASLWLSALGDGTNEGLGRVIASPWMPEKKERDRS